MNCSTATTPARIGQAPLHDAGAAGAHLPRYDAFEKIRREIDPGGVFLNDHLRLLFA